MLDKESRDKMYKIAKPFLIDGCADVLDKEAYLLLLKRIENPKSVVGNIILELMFIANNEILEEISLCKSCYSMTKTIKGKCGKCGGKK